MLHQLAQPDAAGVGADGDVVATGEHVQNRVVFKQLLQTGDAGGVGLCELVQHLSMFDYVAVSGSLDNRVIEYVDHLHEHFTDPVRIVDGNYATPTAPGFSATMRADTLTKFAYPSGPVWAAKTERSAS